MTTCKRVATLLVAASLASALLLGCARGGATSVAPTTPKPSGTSSSVGTTQAASIPGFDVVDPGSLPGAADGTGDVPVGTRLKPGTYTVVVRGVDVDQVNLSPKSATPGEIWLSYDATGTAALRAWTTEHRYQQMLLVLNGRVLSEPRAFEPITDGRVAMSFLKQTDAVRRELQQSMIPTAR